MPDLTQLKPPPNCENDIWRDDAATPPVWIVTIPGHAYIHSDLNKIPKHTLKLVFAFCAMEWQRRLANVDRDPAPDDWLSQRAEAREQMRLWTAAFEEVAR